MFFAKYQLKLNGSPILVLVTQETHFPVTVPDNTASKMKKLPKIVLVVLGNENLLHENKNAWQDSKSVMVINYVQATFILCAIRWLL